MTFQEMQFRFETCVRTSKQSIKNVEVPLAVCHVHHAAFFKKIRRNLSSGDHFRLTVEENLEKFTEAGGVVVSWHGRVTKHVQDNVTVDHAFSDRSFTTFSGSLADICQICESLLGVPGLSSTRLTTDRIKDKVRLGFRLCILCARCRWLWIDSRNDERLLPADIRLGLFW